MQFGGNASNATGQDFTCLRGELIQQIRIFVINVSSWNIMTAMRHGAVGLPVSNTALFVLRSGYG